MEKMFGQNVTSIPSTSNEGIVDGVTEFGSNFIKSIRNDYNDTPNYKSWSERGFMTRLEYKDINVIEQEEINLLFTGYVTKIELLNLPLCTYTLSINGINVMSSNNMVFDIENTHTGTLDMLINYQNKDHIDMNDNVIKKISNRCLDFSRYDNIKLNYNKNYKSLIPEVILLLVYTKDENDDNVVKTTHTIYYNTNILQLHSPTEYISIILESFNKDSRLLMYFYGNVVMDINNIFKNRFVIKFGKTHFTELSELDRNEGNFLTGYDKRVGICGVEDSQLDNRDVETLNFSRIKSVVLVTYKCKLKSVHSAYYMTYYIPINDNDRFVQLYNPDSL